MKASVRYRHVAVALLLAQYVCAVASAESKDGFVAPTKAEINAAIDRGVGWLQEAQLKDGSWGPISSDRSYGGGSGGVGAPTGPTAFALFTLATCDVSPKSKEFKRGLAWLRQWRKDKREHVYSSYERSALILMLAEMDRQGSGRKRDEKATAIRRSKNPRKRPPWSSLDRSDWRWLHENVEALSRHVNRDSGVGYWDTELEYSDLSATQFATLAFRAVSLRGYPVADAESTFWKDLAAYHQRSQNPDGSFSYHPRTSKERSSGMTAAAISSMVICREQMVLLGQPVPPALDTSLKKAQAALDKCFDPARNVAPDRERQAYHYCHLYAVERVGVLSGRREVGDKDWYLRGARFLLDAQHDSGRWTDPTCIRPQDVLGTCFALLFLKKATVPVVTPR